MKSSAEYIQEIWPLSEVAVAETLKESEKGRTIIRIKAREGDFTYRIADESKNEESLRKELFAFSFCLSTGSKQYRNLSRLVTENSSIL